MRTEGKQRRAIVIGASSGMGNEVAHLLLQDGWTLGLGARRTDLLENLAQEFPGQVVVRQIDVNDVHADEILRELIAELNGIELYFHAAGIGYQNHQLDKDKEISTVTTNGLGFTRMVGEAYRYFAIKGQGHIAVISSIAGTKGLGVAPAYSATKAFQNTYIQALEQQAYMRHLNIKFTDIRPGFVRTALLADGTRYPLLMDPKKVARRIVKAIYGHRHICVIDTRYRILTAFWRWLPNALWRRMSIHN